MNQPLVLHVVERLEGLIGKLPATIQKPILSELTPLKELFLQQRPPRLAFLGPSTTSPSEFFGGGVFSDQDHLWHEVNFPSGGSIRVLDARGAGPEQMEEELEREAPDILFFVDDAEGSRGAKKSDVEILRSALRWSNEKNKDVRVIAMVAPERKGRVRELLETEDGLKDRLDDVIEPTARDFTAALLRVLPNEARIEIIRISRDKAAQHQISQVLIKSTAAICTAIGAQPIPLADMPILTTLQLVMVSGIMYVSGRERTMRAATEFVGALGANVGAGILFREGARAILKFLPGWGNVISGMVAGAGTYAVGRAAEAYFIEGVSIKDARRTYRLSRKRPKTLRLGGSKSPRRGRASLPRGKRKEGANNL